jgi:hypothetical protein
MGVGNQWTGLDKWRLGLGSWDSRRWEVGNVGEMGVLEHRCLGYVVFISVTLSIAFHMHMLS